MKKYLCVGKGKILAEWLPRWYNVPFEECIFLSRSMFINNKPINKGLILLEPRPGDTFDSFTINGYGTEGLKIAKTENLLNNL